MTDTYIRINLKYESTEEEILCPVEKYPDLTVFSKDYRKFIKALNYDYQGAGLILASRYLHTNDVFVSTHRLVSVSTDLYTIDRDPTPDDSEEESEGFFPFNDLKVLAEAVTKIATTLDKIDLKLEKPKKKSTTKKKKILLETNKSNTEVKKNDKANNKK